MFCCKLFHKFIVSQYTDMDIIPVHLKLVKTDMVAASVTIMTK